MSRILIALGGNALGDSAASQRIAAANAAGSLAEYIARRPSDEFILVHGNGPQVGMLYNAFAAAGVDMPFPECGAMSQGYIGYHLQNALGNELVRRGCARRVVSVVSQVRVDPNDPAFFNPQKPIGSFCTKAEAQAIMRENPNLLYIEDSGRGWRRVVPSPLPKEILEAEAVEALCARGDIVIAAGGGGIGVVESGGGYVGVDCVIDKDRAASLLAQKLSCGVLMILTAVDFVYINYNTPSEEKLTNIDVDSLRKLVAEKHFAAGSMLPKIEAAIEFTESGENRICLIASLERASDALSGRTGTLIYGGRSSVTESAELLLSDAR